MSIPLQKSGEGRQTFMMNGKATHFPLRQQAFDPSDFGCEVIRADGSIYPLRFVEIFSGQDDEFRVTPFRRGVNAVIILSDSFSEGDTLHVNNGITSGQPFDISAEEEYSGDIIENTFDREALVIERSIHTAQELLLRDGVLEPESFDTSTPAKKLGFRFVFGAGSTLLNPEQFDVSDGGVGFRTKFGMRGIIQDGELEPEAFDSDADWSYLFDWDGKVTPPMLRCDTPEERSAMRDRTNTLVLYSEAEDNFGTLRPSLKATLSITT